jgi:outer membrane protein assembly factor BamB
VRRVALAAVLLLAAVPASARTTATGVDWGRFDYDAARHGVGPATGLTAASVAQLHRQAVRLDGTVDSTPIYLHDVRVRGRVHDVFFVTTTYGRTEAIDAANGSVLWRYVPPAYSSIAGSAQITNMTPVADPDRAAIYAGAPDGRIRKLRVSDGKQLWSTSITRDPTHEKLTSSLNLSRGGLVLATTGGYIGDAPPYQGKVVSLQRSNGRIVHVWNSLCSNRREIIQPSSCSASDSAIWARSGAVVDPASGDILVATGNGPWNGSTNWGDSVLVLSPDAGRLLKHWTPENVDELERTDGDLGSTAPALLDGGYFVQGGKDGKLRLLRLQSLAGVDAKRGGELQTVSTPGGTDLFSAPAVWRGSWVFVSDERGTEAWVLRGGKLARVWGNGNAGTSPIVAGGLLYVGGSGGIRVYVPSSGRQVAELPIGTVHWQSPIAVDGRVAMPEGNANDHATSGVLDIFRR